MFTHTDQPDYVELDANIVNGVRWYNTPSGVKYPSVTSVLSGTKDMSGLDAWRKSLGVKKADKETKRCQDRGEAVHLMAEHYLNNVEDPTFEHLYEHVKLFNQLKFRLNRIDNVRALEIPLFSDKLKIAGRVDCVGEYDGVLSIIDFKTANRNKAEELIEDYKLQCTAYALMYWELFGVNIEDYAILVAVEKGMMPLEYKGKIDDHIKPLLKRINTFQKVVKTK